MWFAACEQKDLWKTWNLARKQFSEKKNYKRPIFWVAWSPKGGSSNKVIKSQTKNKLVWSNEFNFKQFVFMFSKARQSWISILLWIFTENTLHWLSKKVNSAHQKKISANAKFMVMWCEFPNTWLAMLWLAVIHQSRVMSGLVCQKSINHTVEVKRVKDPGDFSLFKWGEAFD